MAGNPKYLKRIDQSNAGAIIVSKQVDEGEHNLVSVENPMVAFALIVRKFNPEPEPVARIHPQAAAGLRNPTVSKPAVGPGPVRDNA